MKKDHYYPINMKIHEPDSNIKGYIIAVYGFYGSMGSSAIQALAVRMEKNEIAV